MTATPRIPADLRAAGERCRVKRRPPPAPPRTGWERLQIAAGFGCFHTLASDRRPAYVIGVSHVAAGMRAESGAPLPYQHVPVLDPRAEGARYGTACIGSRMARPDDDTWDITDQRLRLTPSVLAMERLTEPE